MDRRDWQHLAIAAIVIVLVGLTYWLMSAITQNARLEECLQQRRRNCEQVLR